MRTQTGSMFSSPFLDVYYFADLAVDTLRDAVESGQEWSDFMSDLAYQAREEAFPRVTVMHRFLREMVSRSMYDQDFAKITAPDLPAYVAFQRNAIPFEFQRIKLGVERALTVYELPFTPFKGWPVEPNVSDEDAFFLWYQELQLTEEYATLIAKLANEVFTILFANRVALCCLNDWLATKIVSTGSVKRREAPAWARRAVFFRDRGRCSICGSDLSGLLSLNISPTFDHIVPLVAAGPNDVTNLQLLCAHCNLTKGGRPTSPTFTYEPWFEAED